MPLMSVPPPVKLEKTVSARLMSVDALRGFDMFWLIGGYGLLQALTGVRYDAVEKTLHIDSKIGNDFRVFLATESGFGTAGLRDGKPFVDVKSGKIRVKQFVNAK